MTDQAGNMDFGEWLMGQQKRKDAVGELARYAKRHKGFRRDITYREFRKFLQESSPYDPMGDIANQTVLEYMKYREGRKRRFREMSWPRRRRS
jgi:hypothetical protein